MESQIRKKAECGVSVIIPAYNAAATIRDTLQSLCAQTLPQWEAVVVDDGSTDDTAVVAAEFAEQDRRFRLARQSRLGGSAARNRGLVLAMYDWLLFLDADDWILPRHLERLTEEARVNPELDGVHCGWTRVMPDGVPGHPVFAPDRADMFDLFTQTCTFQLNACLVRRSCVWAAGGFDDSLASCQDWDFWQRIARTGARFGSVHEVLARYRTRPGSVSLNGTRLLHDGLRVITRGHAPDTRVPEPATAHANGRSPAHLARARLQFACWPAGLLLGTRQDARPLLAALQPQDCDPELDPALVAAFIFEAALLPNGQLEPAWAQLWPEVEENVVRFLETLAQQAGAPELAQASLVQLAELILANIEQWPFTVGPVHAIGVEVTLPLPDITLPAGTDRLHCTITQENDTLGVIEIPAHEVSSSKLAEDIAAEHTWPILGRFFAHTLYPSLRRTEQDGSVSWWRGEVCLAQGLPANRVVPWAQLHNKVGWALFLQELWGRPCWPVEDFYNEALEDTAAIQLRSGTTLTLAVHESLPDIETAVSPLAVTLTIGRAALDPVAVTADQGIINAQSLRVALTTQAGFTLCRLAVREGLIGTPLHDETPLRTRLARRAGDFTFS